MSLFVKSSRRKLKTLVNFTHSGEKTGISESLNNSANRMS